MFRAELSNIIDPNHGLVKLAKVVEWNRLDELFGSTYCPDNGRPGVSTRLMVLSHHKERVDICDDLNASAADFRPVFKQYLLKKAVQRAHFQPL